MPPESSRSRYFTPAEANALLPELSHLLDAATERARRYQQLVVALRDGAVSGATNRVAAQREADQLRREAMEIVEEMVVHGVEVKGLEQGLLDFPALRDGVEVYLCWRRGEPALAWWHPLSTGVAGRKPLEGDTGDWHWFN